MCIRDSRRIVSTISEGGARMPNCRIMARLAVSAAGEENLMAPGEEAMSAGVIALDCEGPFKKRYGLYRLCRHRQEDVGKCAQNEIIGIQIFRPFAFRCV